LKKQVQITAILCISLFLVGQSCKVHPSRLGNSDEVKQVEMRLSAFGVESDGFPNINAFIDLQSDTGYCEVSYYNPKFRNTTYRLTKETIDSVRYFISHANIKRLKRDYSVSNTDEPSSTIDFHFFDSDIQISDYGLEGPSPLKDLYRLVYKLNVNIR
jgi:hypothetical protein